MLPNIILLLCFIKVSEKCTGNNIDPPSNFIDNVIKRKSGRGIRFSKSQNDKLKEFFKRNRTPKPCEMERLAEEIGLTFGQVKVKTIYQNYHS